MRVFLLGAIAAALVILCAWPQSVPVPAVPRHGMLAPLFNGRDLTGFDTVLKKQGFNQDPDGVFQVNDGVLHISGSEFGYAITQKEYENYYLRAEFKWGTATYAPRAGQSRDSGILYHVTGPLNVWPRAIEFQIQEGGTGDIWLVEGSELTVRGKTVKKDWPCFDRFGKGPFKDVTGYRDPVREVEKPHGEWNVVELIADHDRVTYRVNGKVVNEGSGANPSRGRILFQSEGAEVFFRNIELAPLQ
jgi:hypothetical protein